MIITAALRGETIGVLGLGITGFATVNAILASKSNVVVWDDNPRMLEELFSLEYKEDDKFSALSNLLLKQAVWEQKLLQGTDEDCKKLSLLVVSPGVSLKHPIVQKAQQYNVKIFSDINILQSICSRAHYIGITGTNGKSTTTSLLGHIYKHCNKLYQVGGNIGTPALALNPMDNCGTYILEISSFQLDVSMQLQFDVAILLNISPDHLDRYDSFDAYIKSKSRIFAGKPKMAVISIDYSPNIQVLQELLKQKQKIIAISVQSIINNGISLIDGVLYDYLEPECQSFMINIPQSLCGPHNAENIAAAYATCRYMGLPSEQIIQAISSFIGLPHRMQILGHKRGLLWVNDSKATNAASTQRALETYSDIIWIAGGICKDDGIEQMVHLFHKLKHVYLIGRAAPQFAQILNKYNVAYNMSETLENAMAQIASAGYSSGTVLLSPACSSLDQWRNFEVRGESFAALVSDLD